MDDFWFNLGYLVGKLQDATIEDQLIKMGASDSQLDQLVRDLKNIAKLAYRKEDADDTDR